MKHIITIAAFAVLFTSIARAAVFTVTPSANNKIVFSIDTQKESINAVGARLSFDPQEFSIEAVSDGGSVVDLWVEKPIISNDAGTLEFSGIIPGGINTEKGTILTIIIAPKRTGISKGFTIGAARALLNDGKGTQALLSLVSGPFSMAVNASNTTANPSTAPDTQAPDPFIPEIARDSQIFDGKYFLVFSTTDGRSGIDHYEVLETSNASWQVAKSPYLLQDQTLSGDIYVRAVDKAGNFRMVKVPTAIPGGSLSSAWRNEAYFIGLVILFCIGISLLAWHKKTQK